MTARDLLQQRYTLANGDTAWRPSALVTAAQEGKLLLLDGIHRVNLGTLSVLSRYIVTYTQLQADRNTCTLTYSISSTNSMSTVLQLNGHCDWS